MAAAGAQPLPTELLTTDELNQAFAHAAARTKSARWRPASPIEWAIHGARADGCFFVDAHNLVDLAGCRLYLTQGTPAMLKVFYPRLYCTE